MHWMESGVKSWRTMALAGVFAGLACGCKLTAGPTILIAVPLALLLIGAARARVRDIFAGGPGGFFAVADSQPDLAHNPVFPEGMSIFGRGHFSQVQEQRWQKAHSRGRIRSH